MTDDPLQTARLPRVDVRAFLPAPLVERWGRDADAGARRAVRESLERLLGALTTYLPRHLLHELMLRPEPGRAHGAFLSSTVLFADVSGFTAMSERLTALGREGAETLTGVINDYFTTMSDIAAQLGGDLMLFGGDAMLLLFDGVDHALRACHAAWRMQRAMRERFAEVETVLGAFPLRMAVGLGSGSVFATALGSADSMHYAVMGPALIAMGHAESLAGAGRIIMDGSTRLLAGDLAVGAEGDSGFFGLAAEPTAPYTRPDPPVLDLPPAAEDLRLGWLAQRLAAIAPFVPPGLLPRLLPDPAALLEGEHRPVTVLFIDFRDADALIDILGADDPVALTPRLNAAFNTMRSIVARYEGVVNKIGGGPAGPHVIALFGAPVSHEDDPERAVHAALEIGAALSGADLPGVYPVRIGINTGFVYAANVGSHVRREYTVMGDQVNLAARLMAAAQPGQIVVSASTATHVEHLFDLEEREPVTLKGKSQPQRSFLARSGGARRHAVRAPAAAPGELLGRSDVVSAARERIAAAAQGRGQVVALTGEVGIGKSRLVETLAEQVAVEGFDVVAGACLSYGRDTPYSVWVEPLRALAEGGIQPSDAEADRRARLAAKLQAIDRLDDLPIVAELVGAPVFDSGWTASLDAQTRQRRLFDAAVSLVRHRAHHAPLLLVIDDAQWIDSASLDLLNHLVARIGDARVVLLVASRSERKWSGWADLPNAAEIVLQPLDRPAIETMIADLLGIDDRRLPLAVRTLLERMAAGGLSATPDAAPASAFERYWGNPFFAQERVRALIESGVLARDASGQWQVARPIESIEMPDTIHGVIMSRIDRLPEPARRALQVAAVVGRAVDLDLLHAVYDVPGESLESLRRHLNDLAHLGLLPVESGAGRARYAFRSVTTQEVAYDSLRYERRRELHRRIGEVLEKTPTLGDDRSGLLTHHFFEGQMWDKALGYALEAGWRAQHQYANAAAAAAYRRALTAAEKLSPPRTLEQLAAHEALGDVLSITGEYEEALRSYERARMLAAEDASHVADLCRKTADVHRRRSEFEYAYTWLSRGSDLAPLESLVAAQIHLVGAAISHRQGKHDEAVAWCEKSLQISRSLADDAARRTEAHALYLLAGIAYKRGNLEGAVEAAREAVAVYLVLGDLLGQSQALNTLATAYTDRGDFALARQCYTDSLQLKERIGDIADQATITINLGEVYRALGELDQARQMFERSLYICRDLHYEYAVALLHNNLAAIAIAEGKWRDADHHLAESERLFKDIGSEDFKAEILRHRAELSLWRGRTAEAISQVRQALAEADAGEEKLEIALSRRVLGQILLAQDDLTEAERELQLSLEELQGIGSVVEAANTRLALARLRERQNRTEEARQLIAAAIETYQSVGAEPLIAQARAVLREDT
ncbi:MAG TPA: adenylate/guanylate cyclase domain-containing protein [Anaerolineae bacterium]|nr:adenylate/guanylate cyclase domain-containing protein [Anaerolineae bacterium]